jgi:capsular exopolysaccharide synthesis family protein
MDIWEILRILRARRWTLLSVWFLTLLGAATAAWVQKPIYAASSTVLIQPRPPRFGGAGDFMGEGEPSPQSIVEYYRTQYELMKSTAVMRPVADQLHIQDREEFRNAPDPMTAFAETVKVEPVHDTRLVRITVESESTTFAISAANAIANHYIAENTAWLTGVGEAGLDNLRALARKTRPEVEQAQQAVQSYKKANGLLTSSETGSGGLEPSPELSEVRSLTEQQTITRAKKAQVDADLKAVSDLMDEKHPTTPSALGAARVLEDLLVEKTRLVREVHELEKIYKPDHPELRDALTRLSSAEQELKGEFDRIRLGLQMDARTAESQERSISDALAAAKENAAAAAEKTGQLKVLVDDAANATDKYKKITDCIDKLEMQSVSSPRSQNVSIVNPAKASPQAVKPRKSLYLAFGLLLGLALGAGLCLLLDFLDQRIKSTDDLQRLVPRSSVLGYVPAILPSSWDEAVVPELECMFSPRSALAENLRTIRTGVNFAIPDGAPRALLVTSAEPGDGKTTVSANLAITLAQAGQRVLLLDCDFRNSRLHEFFELGTVETGLSTTLVSGATSLDTVRATNLPNLDVLPAGPEPGNPAELLGSDQMRVLLEGVLSAYDWVVIDAPPTVVADPSILLTFLPYYALVVRFYSTTKGAILRAQETLARTPAKSLGLVVNLPDVPDGVDPSGLSRPKNWARPRAAEAAALATARAFIIIAVLCAGAAAALFRGAWHTSKVTFNVTGLAPDSPRQTLSLGPGEEIAFVASGKVAAGELLARVVNPTKQFEAARIQGVIESTRARIARLGSSARPGPATERARLEAELAAEQSRHDELMRAADVSIVSSITGTVVSTKEPHLGRPFCVAYLHLSIQGEVTGIGADSLTPDSTRFTLETDDRRDVCTILQVAPGPNGAIVTIDPPGSYDWHRLLKPDGETFYVASNVQLASRIGSDPPLWVLGGFLGFVSLGVLVVAAVTYRKGRSAQLARAPIDRPFPADALGLAAGSANYRRLAVPQRVFTGRPAMVMPTVASPPPPTPAAPPSALAPSPSLPAGESQVLVTEIHPGASSPDRAITQVAINGKSLELVTQVFLKDTPCVIQPRAKEATGIVVSVPVYLVPDGQWHFTLKTGGGQVVLSPAAFTVLPPPPPLVTLVRPTEVPKNKQDPASVDLEGFHLTRLLQVRLVDAQGVYVCAVAQEPDPEPNDKRIRITVPGEIRHGTFRVVVETRSGASRSEGPELRVLPDLADRIDDLRFKVYRRFKLENLEAALREKVESRLWEAKELDAATLEALKATRWTALMPAEDLTELHDELARISSNDKAKAKLDEIRVESPIWMSDVMERALARHLADMEPKVRSPSPSEIEGHMRASANAIRLLKIAEALIFSDERAKKARASFDANLALYQQKELPHVLSKIRDHLAAIVGVAVFEGSEGDEGFN